MKIYVKCWITENNKSNIIRSNNTFGTAVPKDTENISLILVADRHFIFPLPFHGCHKTTGKK